VEPTPEAEELFIRLAAVAPADDVAQVRTAASLEAARLHHDVVVPGHIITILVRGGADRGLLADLGVDPDATPAQLLDRTKAEVDAAPRGPAPDDAPRRPAARTVESTTPCPECGDTGPRRHEVRRVPKPAGARGSTTARIAVCGACGAPIGPG
jgi:hypothetical protein